jgi:hypothetical protein
MTLKQALHDYLRDVVDVSVFDTRLSTRPMMPALVLRLISAVSVQTHSNPRSLLARRVQVDVYAWNEPEVDETARLVLLALDGYHGPMLGVDIGWSSLANDLDMQPAEPKGDGKVLFHRIMDFEVSYQEPRIRPVPVTS